MKSTADELANSSGLSSETLKKLGSVLRSHPAVEQIILFGSRAMNRHQSSSDIDLALKGAQLNFSNILQLKSAIDELMLSYKVDLVIYETIQKKDLKEHIDRLGIVLLLRTLLENELSTKQDSANVQIDIAELRKET